MRRVLRGIVAVAARMVDGGLVVDDAIRLSGDGIQVLRERGPVHRREEVVGQDESVGVRPVVRDARPVVVVIPRHVLARADDVESVHRAAVDRVQARREPVRDVVRLDVGGLRQLVVRPWRADAVRARQRPTGRTSHGAGVGREVVVEGPVLLDQEDDVLDGAVGAHDAVVPAVTVPVSRAGLGLWAADVVPPAPKGQNCQARKTTAASPSAETARRRRICVRVGLRRRPEAGRMIGSGGCCTMGESIVGPEIGCGTRAASRRAGGPSLGTGDPPPGCAARRDRRRPITPVRSYSSTVPSASSI